MNDQSCEYFSMSLELECNEGTTLVLCVTGACDTRDIRHDWVCMHQSVDTNAILQQTSWLNLFFTHYLLLLEKVRTFGLAPPQMTFRIEKSFWENPSCVFQKLFPALSDVRIFILDSARIFLILFGFLLALQNCHKTDDESWGSAPTLLRRNLLFTCHNSTRWEQSKRNPYVVIRNIITCCIILDNLSTNKHLQR